MAGLEEHFTDDVALMIEEVKAAGGEGVSCIVDAGHADMGRDFEFLKQLSTKSGMPIVASGGFYSAPFYPPEIATMSEEQIVQKLVEQAKNEPLGAYGEIGSWDEMTDTERTVFRAVG